MFLFSFSVGHVIPIKIELLLWNFSENSSASQVLGQADILDVVHAQAVNTTENTKVLLEFLRNCVESPVYFIQDYFHNFILGGKWSSEAGNSKQGQLQGLHSLHPAGLLFQVNNLFCKFSIKTLLHISLLFLDWYNDWTSSLWLSCAFGILLFTVMKKYIHPIWWLLGVNFCINHSLVSWW